MGAPKGNQYALGNNGGRPRKYKTVEELQTIIDEYFASCWTNTVVRDKSGEIVLDDEGKPIIERVRLKPYTVTGLARALGMTRQMLLDYEERNEFTDSIRNAKEAVQEYVEELLITAKNAVGPIFNLKANYKWKDVQDVNVNLTTLAATLKDLGD